MALQSSPRVRHASSAFCIGLVLGQGSPPARADDFIVYSPYVIESQNEIELRGYAYADARPDLTGSAAELSVSRGVTRW